jgi:hypothetical protein
MLLHLLLRINTACSQSALYRAEHWNTSTFGEAHFTFNLFWSMRSLYKEHKANVHRGGRACLTVHKLGLRNYSTDFGDILY